MKLPLSHDQRAATMLDVLVVVFLVIVGMALFLPTLARNDRGGPRAQCTASMKQAVLGFILWANDREGLGLPFRVPYEKGGLMNPVTNKINIPEIGQFDPPLRSNAWLQFAFIHKELQGPKVLVCPADKKRKIATAWGNTADGGFTHPKIPKQRRELLHRTGCRPMGGGVTDAGAPE